MSQIFAASASRTGNRRPRRERRGVALVFVLMFVVGMAALAMSSIFLASNANLLAKSYDNERDLKFAAEMGLQIGKSRVNQDPSILVMGPTQIDTAILKNATLTDASGTPLAGIQVSVYLGPTGSTSGQAGRFSSIVSVATDPVRRNSFIRRLELTQESFAKFAYWSNQENQTGASTIFFNNGDALWGPVWSNDTINVGSGGATFHDDVGTASILNGASYGVFSKGYRVNQKPIALPSTSILATLQTISSSSGWDFPSAAAASTNENSVRDRLEFIAADLNASGDSTDLNEGMFRIFTARSTLSNPDAVLRGDWVTATPSASNVEFCGDWHTVRVQGAAGTSALQFFPASVHNTAWFKTTDSLALRDGGSSASSANSTANSEASATLSTIMGHANARCYLPGDTHLAAVERNSSLAIDPATGAAYAAARWQIGGQDTTFTPVGKYGSWRVNTTSPNATIISVRGQKNVTTVKGSNIGDANFLFPIDRLYNPNAKGVIHFNGNVGLSGTLNGRITLYANGSIMLLDDLRYANDPVKGVCRDILGIISDKDIVLADNTQLDPINLTNNSGGPWMNADETKDVDIHAVMMALGNSFRVENYNSGPTNVNGCGTVNNGRGCINLSGGLIQNIRGAVGQSNGTGFSKRYAYDHCAVVNPPPYFPTTGRFQDNRYLELDPAGFDDKKYFLSILP